MRSLSARSIHASQCPRPHSTPTSYQASLLSEFENHNLPDTNIVYPGRLKKAVPFLLAVICVMFMSAATFGQTTIFTESMGTVAGTTTIAAHETANGFDNDGYTMSSGGAANPADIRATSVSTGAYTGASGGANVFFTATSGERGFAIAGIDASGYTGLTLSFGVRKEDSAGTAFATFVVEYSINNGSSWTALTVTGFPTTSSAAGWYLISGISLPADAQINGLSLRWRKTGTIATRIDDVKLTGTVAVPLDAEPTVQASNVQFTSTGTTSMTVSWTNGDGAGRIVLAKAGAAVDATPSDGTSYTANSAFGSGSQIGTGNYVVFSGAGNSVVVTGLTPNTTYHFAVFEFNGSGGSTNYLTTSPATGSNATLAAVSISGHVTNATGGDNIAGITVTLSGDSSATTTTDASGNYTFANLASGGNYTVTPSKAFTYSPSSRVYSSLASNVTNADFSGTRALVISEFRFRGPNGGSDEFIEITNVSSVNQDISGLKLRGSSNSGLTITDKVLTTITVSTTLPPGGHYLITNDAVSPNNYSLTGYATADATYLSTAGFGDDGGVAFTTSGNTVIDQVGFSSSAGAFREGTPLTTPITSGTGQYSYVRKSGITGGVPQDTNNNATDFVLVSTTATVNGSTPVALGAPGPENLNSPIQHNTQFIVSLFDTSVGSTTAPNRIRENTGASVDTLKIRRSFVNNTGGDVNNLRFRIIKLSTLNNKNGIRANPAEEGDFRIITSADETLSTGCCGTKTALKTTRQEPPDQTTTGLDGGLNTSLSITIPGLPLTQGEGFDANFWLRIATNGYYTLVISVETGP